MKKTETIYEILYTPVEKLREDQVQFLERVVDVSKEKRVKPWFALINTAVFVGALAGTIAAMFVSPLAWWSVLASLCGIATLSFSCCIFGKIFKMANYKEFNTNKWSFEEFELEKGIEQINEKLKEYDMYCDKVNMSKISFPNYEKEICTRAQKQDIETNTKNETLEENELSK